MYEESFGLRMRPFGVTPDPGAFYSNRQYAEAEANLLYAIRERRGFALLTGEVGTGKTTVLRRVMEQLAGVTPFVLLFHTNLSLDEILTFLCHELDITVTDPTRLGRIEALNAYLLEQTRHGRTTALLVDEAQDLADDALEGIRLLSNLETNGEKLLQIVLVGQPELEARLDSPDLRQLRQRIALRSRLERLEAREVGAYVRRRLECAGAKRDLFASDAIARVAVYSKGVPRVINLICDNALLIAYAASRPTVTGDLVTEVADDLRLRESAPPSRENDLLGIESALHRVEQETKTRRVTLPPPTRDLVWAGAFVGLFLAAGVLATSSWRDDARPSPAPTNTAADARALLPLRDSGPEPPATASPALHAERAPAPAPAPSHAAPEASASPATADSPPPPTTREEPTGDAPAPLVFSVPRGATAYQIAAAAYESWCQLGLDLMAEANPDVPDLDRLQPGQPLRLPPLGAGTLQRFADDGTERIVLASYANVATANRFAAQAARRSGYDVRVSPRRVSGRVVSHRVEIVGLPHAEVARAWKIAGELELLPPEAPAFAGTPPSADAALRATCADSRTQRAG